MYGKAIIKYTTTCQTSPYTTVLNMCAQKSQWLKAN